MSRSIRSRGVLAKLLPKSGFVAAFALVMGLLVSQLTHAQVPIQLLQSDNFLPLSNDSLVQSADTAVEADSVVGDDDSGLDQDTMKGLLGPLSTSVVQIRNRDRLCCLGTIVAEGLVVTKRSELSGSLTCVTGDGTKVAAVIVASDQVDDLALLRLTLPALKDESLVRAVKFGAGLKVESGDVLLSVGQNFDPISVGVATVAPQQLPVAQPVCRDCVDLGVTVSGQPTGVDLQTRQPGREWLEVKKIYGAKVQRVYPRTVGERVGMLRGDLLVSINQQWIPNATTLRSVGARVRVGQALNVVVVRKGQLKQLSMKIDHFSRRVYHDRWGGGPFSERRFGFSTTIVHDSLLEPNQCGGPVVDLDGNVVGLNIARSMRVATLAVPSDRVLIFVNRFRYLASSP